MPEPASRFTAAVYDQQNEDRVADWGGDDLFTRMPRPRAVDDAPAPRFRPSLVLVESADPRSGDAADGSAGEPADHTERRRAQTAEEAMRERAERLGLTVVAPPAGDPAAPWAPAPPAGDPATPWESVPPAGELAAPREPAPPAVDPATPWESAPPAVPVADSPWDPAAWDAATHATTRRWDGQYGAVDRAPNGRRTTVITGRPDGAPRPLSLAPAERRRPAKTPAEWVGPRPERIVAWAFALGLLLILIAISTADAATL